ncbi:MAG: heme-binding protein [Chromatiales bacterium]|jgi:uncharacterized protein GlcG (DUF336 family)|nr:heme-binding protein [Chromatiales bacterium]
MTISLTTARTVVRAALAAGRAEDMMPLTVAVLDPGGHLIALEREDGSGIIRVEIATGKAYAALGMGAPTRTLRDRLADRPNFVSGLASASGGRFVAVPGGVLLHDATNTLVGAVGISGDTSDRDEYCAITAAYEAGLIPAPKAPIDGWRGSKL